MKDNELICPECGSDEIYRDRIPVEGLKPWYCDDCGFDSDTEKDFIRKEINNE
jgi:predicted RNA-binding Zn-ribbon protein involved in translation (DUF1610 family)